MARATGVQISETAVRVVDIDGSPKKFKVRGAAELPIDPWADDDERVLNISKALKEAFKVSKASREHVIYGVAIGDCVIREITVPFTEVDQIKKIIKFESEPHLHSCSIEDVIICFHKVAESGSRSSVLVVAARKEKIHQGLTALERIGIDPLSIDLGAAGLFSASQVLEVAADKRDFLMLDIGRKATTVVIVAGAEMRMVRSVRLGTDSITSRVGRDLELGMAEAETRTMEILNTDRGLEDDLMVQVGDVAEVGPEATKSASELERDIVRQRQAELLQRLEQEVRRTLNTANLDEPAEAVFVTGPGSRLPRLHEELAERIGLPVEQLSVLDQMDHNLRGDAVEIYDAIAPAPAGLALKHLGNDPIGLDFRQEEFVFANRFERLKVPLVCMVILLSAVNACWWLFEKSMAKAQENVVREFAARASSEFGRTFKPGALSANDLDVVQLSEKDVNRLHKGQEKPNPHDRIVYIGRTLTKQRAALRKLYDLDNVTRRKEGGRGSSGGSAGTKKSVADFSSALERWEQVFTALDKLGVKEMAINQLKVTSVTATLSLTLPEVATFPDGKKLDFQGQIARLKDIFGELPPEVGYLDLTTPGNYEARDDGRGFDFPKVEIAFKKEK